MRGQGAENVSDPGINTQSARPASPVMFWLLLALALAVFLPCVILPAWRDYQAVALAAQVEDQRAASARDDLKQRRRALDALRQDPAVATRLAQRELAYVRPGHSAVRVPGVVLASAAPRRAWTLTPVEPPPAVAAVVARLPKADYDRLFLDEPTRTILMALSGGVLLAAFALGRSVGAPNRPGAPHPSRPTA